MRVGKAAVCVLSGGFFLWASAVRAADTPRVEVRDLIVAKATVEKIDLSTREVTLKRSDGASETVRVGPESVNLDRVKTGDEVTVKFRQTLTISAAPPDSQPSLDAVANLERAARGEAPGGWATRVVEAVVTVDALDPAAQTMTVRGPRGNRFLLGLGDQMKKLAEVKVGDLILAQYTEALIVSVEGP